MQEKLESVSGFPVHFKRISDSDTLFTGSLGRYHFDSQRGHIVSLNEVGDAFDELRAAMEISHGLLFFDGYPGVLGSPADVCALVTDTIHHPAMRSVLRSNDLEDTFDRYYVERTETWIKDARSLSRQCNTDTDSKIRYAFFFLEAVLVSERFRETLRKAFSSATAQTWSIAQTLYATVFKLFPADQLRLRKALVHCLAMISELGKETQLVVVPPVLEEAEKSMLGLKVFDVEENKRSDAEYDVTVRYKSDNIVGTVVGMDFSDLEAFRSWIQSCLASELSEWVNASWRGKDLDSVLAKPTGSE